MSNVLYQCPVCKGRLFAPPGGTPIKCHVHTEYNYVQVEEYVGPNFKFSQEGATEGIRTPGTDHLVPVDRKLETPTLSEDDLKAMYQDQFRRVSNGVEPDKRWGIDRLRKEIEEWEQINTPQPDNDEDSPLEAL